MAINQRAKGGRGEREAAKLLISLGYEARRAQQYQGVSSEPSSNDLVHNVPRTHVEVKTGYGGEDLHTRVVGEWIARADADAHAIGYRWIILWKRDRKPWLALYRNEHGDVVATLAVQSALLNAPYPDGNAP